MGPSSREGGAGFSDRFTRRCIAKAGILPYNDWLDWYYALHISLKIGGMEPRPQYNKGGR